MSLSPRLKLSYISPQQAQKHVSANESFRRLDALTQLAVKSAIVSAEPAAPAEGDAYILPSARAGAAWSAMAAGSVAAFQDGQWLELAPRAGWRAFVEDDAGFKSFDGAAWSVESANGGAPRFDALGVNAAADATNKLTVKSDAALFSHDDVTPGSGDARLMINKSATARTASVVFQNAFSGRAEFGLTGADDFSLKVSADGAAWNTAIVVKSDGKVGIGTTGPTAPLEINPDGVVPNAAITSGHDFAVVKGSGSVSFASIVAGASTSRMVFKGVKAAGTLAAPTAVASGHFLFSMQGTGYDGASQQTTAAIDFVVDGAVSAGVMPTSIQLLTGPASTRIERMRITSAGDVGIGGIAPTTKLHVDGPVRVKSYAKASLPSAAASGAGAMIYVSDEAGGAVIAFSDATNWRRVTDRAVVS